MINKSVVRSKHTDVYLRLRKLSRKETLLYVGHCVCTCLYSECIVRSKMVKGTRSVYVGHCLCTCLYSECIVRSKMVKGTRSVYVGHCLCTCLYTECIERSKMVREHGVCL